MILKTTAIADNKEELAALPTTRVPAPDFVFVPLTNTRCQNTELTIKEGDKVFLGEKLGLRHGPFFDQPLFSTVSGTYRGLEKHGYRNGKVIDFLKIENDHKDTKDPSIKERTDAELDALTLPELVEIAKDHALVGLGGSSFPSYIKLNTKNPIKTILINGIECEPYLTSDQRFMLDHAEDIVKGIRLMMRAYHCHDARIAVKAIHADVVEHLRKVIAKLGEKEIQVSPLKNFYPQGWEVAMIKSILKIDVLPGHLPSEYGVMDFNVATTASLYQAAKYGLPVTERYVSIIGEGINKPSNFIVRVGSQLHDLVKLAGGYKGETNKVLILGGPMMGSAIPNDECITSPTVTTLMVLEYHFHQVEPCIKCGSCVLSCPEGLKPLFIMRLMTEKGIDKWRAKMVNKLEPMKCVECGLCTYSCTSKIPLLYYIRQAKALVRTLPKKQ